MKLSVLDQSPVLSGRGARLAVEATLALAKRADELGYARYWLAEHHAIATLPDPCPELLLAPLRAEPRRMRLRAARLHGRHHRPPRTAAGFPELGALPPRRPDAGLGRAPPGDQAPAHP